DGHRVAQRTGHLPAADLRDLEDVSVKVHGMRHRRLVHERELDTLALPDLEWSDLRPRLTVEGPEVLGHVAAERDADPPVDGPGRERPGRAQTSLLLAGERSCGARRLRNERRNGGARSREHEAGLHVGALGLRENGIRGLAARDRDTQVDSL